MAILKAIAELLGIVVLRFPMPKNLWSILLMAPNAAALIFINTIYGQVVFVAAMAGLVIMVALYMKHGFVRLLGVGHVVWIPMLIWLAQNLPDKSTDPVLYWWVISLLILNGTSLVVDVLELIRYVRGDRQPHYRWRHS